MVTLAAALQVLLQHHLPQLGVRHVLGARQVGGDHHLQLLLADPGDGDGEKNKSTGGGGKECIGIIGIVAESRNCEKLKCRDDVMINKSPRYSPQAKTFRPIFK